MSTSSNPIAQYTITRGVFRSNYDITSNGQHLYHVDNSQWTPGKPDLTFHAGATTNGPIAGVIKYRHFSSDTEIGLGDPSQPHATEWFCLNRDSMMSVRYTIRMSPGTASASASASDQVQKPRMFTWKRTHSLSSSSLSGGLKLVDESNRAVAVLSSGGHFSKTSAQMDVFVQYGDRFQLLVLVSGLALREKLARARTAAAAAGGAGGGGGGA